MKNGAKRNTLFKLCVAIGLSWGALSVQAATYNVTTNADSGAGSLRNAIALANGNAGADQVTFDSDLGVITLTTGQIDITQNLTITGPATGQVISGNEGGRIFGVTVAGKALTLQNLTLKEAATTGTTAAGNCGSSSGQGAAVCALGDLTLANTTIINNYTLNADGGGLYVENGVLTLLDSVITGNNLLGVNPLAGGGAYVTGGAVTMSNSQVRGNATWTDYMPGGGLYLIDSDLDLENSTISGNHTEGHLSPGGGVYIENGDVTLANSTISGNTTALAATQSFGAGLYVDDGDITLRNSTISDNAAAAGGGIWMQTGATNRTLTLRSTILSGNFADNFGSLVGGSGTLLINATYSLYGGAATDINGTNNNNVFDNSPDLGVLVDNGCATPAGVPGVSATCVQTHALNNGSPAINAGANPQGFATDQRGAGYARTLGSDTDIGAFENGPGQLTFSVAGYFVSETGPTASISVSRRSGTSGAVSVDYATSDLTASAGSDYTAAGGTLNWADGDGDDKSFTVPITNDLDAESGEDVLLTLSNPTGGATLGSPDEVTLRINDNDGGPSEVQFSVEGFSVDESGLATITVTRTGNTTGPVFVDYDTSDGTATAGSDYTAASGTLTWPTGVGGDKTFIVPITHDTVIEGDETVILTLSNPQYNGTLGEPSVVALTILDNDPALPGRLSFSTDSYSVGESDGTATITVSRLGGSDGAASVEYAYEIGTATPNVDYTPPYGVLFWPDGDNTDKTFDVTIAPDALAEGDETIELTLFGASGATVDPEPDTATLTIIDNDDAPTPVPGQLRFAVANFAAGEDSGQATITVSRVGGSDGAVSVNYATSNNGATAGSDYTTANGTLNWANGDSADKSFTVTINNDAALETDENVNLTLSGASGGASVRSPNPAQLTIVDNDTLPGQLQFAAVFNPVGEAGGNVTITVSRVDGSDGAASVNWSTSDGTAEAGSDYTAANGTLNWANGDSSDKTFNVAISNDTAVEGQEYLRLALSNPSGATLGSPKMAAAIIGDDDSAGQLQFANVSYAIGEAGPTATITVTRTGGSSGAVSVDYNTANGTATAGSDYTAANGTLNWADGDSADKTFNVTISDDAAVEIDETVLLALGNAGGGATLGTPKAAKLTIADNDVTVAGFLQFSSISYAVDESGPTATITVTRTGGSDGAVSVDYATFNGSASAGSDYTAANGTLNWGDGDSADKSFTVTISDDGNVEGDEKLFLVLANVGGGATLGSPQAAKLTIADNDVAPSPGRLQFTAVLHSIGEAGPTATITVSRTGGSDGAASVDYATTIGNATAGADYTAANGTLNWADGDSADKSFPVSISEDALVEGPEAVVLRLSNASNANLGTPRFAGLFILDNDVAGQLQFSSPTYTTNENGPTAIITVSRVGGSSGAVSALYATSNGSATAGSDYTAAGGTLNWGPGDSADKTFAVPIIADNSNEGAETVILSLAGMTGGATPGTPKVATLTINNVTEDPPAVPAVPVPALDPRMLGVLSMLLALLGFRAWRRGGRP